MVLVTLTSAGFELLAARALFAPNLPRAVRELPKSLATPLKVDKSVFLCKVSASEFCSVFSGMEAIDTALLNMV